jgi:hypothetical protein
MTQWDGQVMSYPDVRRLVDCIDLKQRDEIMSESDLIEKAIDSVRPTKSNIDPFAGEFEDVAPQPSKADDVDLLADQQPTATAGAPPLNSRDIPQPTGLEGLSPEEIAEMREVVRDRVGTRKAAQAAQAFMTEHPEYVATPENWAQFAYYFNVRGVNERDLDRAQIDAAYAFLLENGSLQLTGEPMEPQPMSGQPVQRLYPKPQLERISTGLPDRPYHAPSAPASPDQLANELASLPIEEARRRMLGILHQANNRQR